MKSIFTSVINFFMEDTAMVLLGGIGILLLIANYNWTGGENFPIIPAANMFLLFAVVHRLGRLLFYAKKIMDTCGAWNSWVENEKMNCNDK